MIRIAKVIKITSKFQADFFTIVRSCLWKKYVLTLIGYRFMCDPSKWAQNLRQENLFFILCLPALDAANENLLPADKFEQQLK